MARWLHSLVCTSRILSGYRSRCYKLTSKPRWVSFKCTTSLIRRTSRMQSREACHYLQYDVVANKGDVEQSTLCISTLFYIVISRILVASNIPKMASFDSPAITPGSTILVTGANGFVGAHVADQLLQQGYKVRGTVRDAIKHQWLADLFSQKYGNGRFELMTVKDMGEPSAFDDAVSGSPLL
jgi:FlaA1/EpsC-like NDP-sugar epimerase